MNNRGFYSMQFFNPKQRSRDSVPESGERLINRGELSQKNSGAVLYVRNAIKVNTDRQLRRADIMRRLDDVA